MGHQKPRIFVFGRIGQPTSYVIDRIRRRVALLLKDEFEFHSLGEGILPCHKSEILKKIDVFHGKCWNSSYLYSKILKLRNNKLRQVYTLYGLPLNKKIGKKIVRISDIITTVSLTTLVEAVHEFGDADYRVVYDAVDTDFYKPVKKECKDTVRVLMVISGLRYFKNHMIFLKMAEHFPDVEFVLHTFSPVKTELPNVIIDNFKYPIYNEYGDCKGLRNLYNSADIYLFPSVKEGLNNTILEAMACGLPVIAFNFSSMPELIQHNKNGFLCSNFKDMEYFLSYLIEDEQARKELGKKSREIASWFSWKKCVDGYKKIYDELIWKG